MRFFRLEIGPDPEQPVEPTEKQLKEATELFPGLFEAMEPDDPGMHRSDTVEFILVVSGRILLELDETETVLGLATASRSGGFLTGGATTSTRPP
jgi:hypothetical protein